MSVAPKGRQSQCRKRRLNGAGSQAAGALRENRAGELIFGRSERGAPALDAECGPRELGKKERDGELVKLVKLTRTVRFVRSFAE